ncbi:MAG TPA: glucose 1-dehydrogenase [Acidimicrobiales bacterium]|nr:glucose 1-dehydrogenase [Acidimicrobiales bacterium]
MSDALEGKVALVTGGSRGLGRAMALGFAEAGADVIIASRKLQSCETVAREVEARGRRALALACHVGHWDELEGLVENSYDAFGRVDVLVNNAGMSLLYESLPSVTEAVWDKVVDLNLKGPFRLTALVGSRMAAGPHGGSIINISSTGSIRPAPFMLPYDAAKAGLNALTVGFAHAFGPTVRVNCIMAGPFMTDVTAAWDIPAFEKAAKATHALGRGGQPDEIVGAALYFATDASSYTTGAILRVDGGIP